MVPELGGYEEESGLEHVHGDGDGRRVEVLELDLRHHVVVRLQRDLEDVALLSLDQEEEHRLGLVRGRGDEQHAAVRVVQIILPKQITLL